MYSLPIIYGRLFLSKEYFMKIILRFIGLFCFIIYGFGQNYKMVYSFEMKYNSKHEGIREYMVLLQKGQESEFLNQKYYVIDSINRQNPKQKQYITPRYSDIVKNSSELGKSLFYKHLDGFIYEYPKFVQLKWNIHKEKKDILGYHCQRATVDYGGRHWEAWFSNEIPIQSGPYVFRGLPGFILEIKDIEEYFKYQMISIEKQHEIKWVEPSAVMDGKIERLKEDRWLAIVQSYYNNPIANYKLHNWKMYKQDGSEFTEQDYKEMGRQIQNELKRKNNPIEKEYQLIVE
ncbi:GLPGLI family protein [Riemerella anatipestifer]|nr:GLPGLI family protein [Riemerella anatipestifer]AZZ59664.1 GLPGLI family protein [Riemerella anatipestifer]MDD1538608.1 GLPGLI family protein [Riemerella anatipestifer]MRM95207.1 GLPGLI family protein [Riemerella anatipestifer]MRM96383.1 GLPGLI family protein [Riemerella anatipestifer]MRN00724.1 GLPGLI family protein [Riemerella anatipestifer]